MYNVKWHGFQNYLIRFDQKCLIRWNVVYFDPDYGYMDLLWCKLQSLSTINYPTWQVENMSLLKKIFRPFQNTNSLSSWNIFFKICQTSFWFITKRSYTVCSFFVVSLQIVKKSKSWFIWYSWKLTFKIKKIHNTNVYQFAYFLFAKVRILYIYFDKWLEIFIFYFWNSKA